MDIFDYGIGNLWLQGHRRGRDHDRGDRGLGLRAGRVRDGRQFDATLGLPDPQVTTIYPAGPLPKKCPPGMAKPRQLRIVRVLGQGN